MVASNLQAFRYIFLISVVVTIILVIIDPVGDRIKGASQGLAPWTSKWFLLALLFLLFILGLLKRGRLAWLVLVIFILFAGIFHMYLYFDRVASLSA